MTDTTSEGGFGPASTWTALAQVQQRYLRTRAEAPGSMDEWQAALLVANVLLRLHTCVALTALDRLAIDIRPAGSQLVRADGLGDWSARLRWAARSIDVQLLDPETSKADEWCLTYRNWLLLTPPDEIPALLGVLTPLEQLAARLSHSQSQKRKEATPCDLFAAILPVRNKALAHGALGLDFWAKAIPTVTAATDWLTIHSPLWRCDVLLPLARASGPARRVLRGTSPSEVRPGGDLTDTRPQLVVAGEAIGALPPLIMVDPVHDHTYFANGHFIERDKTGEYLCEAIAAAEPGDDRRRIVVTDYALVPDPGRSETEGHAALRQGPAGVFHNLPARPVGFVSRGSVERDLWIRLADRSRRHLLTVRGIGGIGKTSLILELCHRLAIDGQEPVYDFVVWLSARDIDLTLEGPRQVRRATSSLQEVWTRVARLFDASRTDDPQKSFEREVQASPVLLVLDNFETFDDQSRLFQYLNEVVVPPSKAVLTSRHAVPGESIVDLKGMDLTQARELLLIEARRLNREPLMTDGAVSEIYEAFHGHPYAMKLAAARRCTTGGSQRAIKGAFSDEQVLEALFRRSIDDLGSLDAEFVVLLIGEFAGGLSEDALRIVCNPHDIDVDAALEILQLRSLIEVVVGEHAPRFDMPTMAREFSRTRLIKGHLLQGQVEAAASFLRGVPELVVGDWHEAAQKLESRIERGREVVRDQSTLDALQVLAEAHGSVWARVARVKRARALPESEWGDAYKRAVELAPGRAGVLLEWSNFATNPDEQVRLKVQAVAAEPDNAELAALVARFLNRWYAGEPKRYSELVWHGLIEPVATSLERRVHQLDGDALANLAWLYLHDGRQRERAARVVDLGLQRDPGNKHLKGLIAGGRARLRPSRGGELPRGKTDLREADTAADDEASGIAAGGGVGNPEPAALTGSPRPLAQRIPSSRGAAVGAGQKTTKASEVPRRRSNPRERQSQAPPDPVGRPRNQGVPPAPSPSPIARAPQRRSAAAAPVARAREPHAARPPSRPTDMWPSRKKQISARQFRQGR